MNRDQALSKIRKCLAMAKGGTEHEAAAAMRQAQKLMAEHRITDRELSMVDIHEVRVKAPSQALNRWEVHLGQMISDAFGCNTFSSLDGSYNGAGNYVATRYRVFVGFDAAPTVAGYAYEVLARQCAKARLAHIAKQSKNCKAITKTARGDAFAGGWVAAVADLIERFANPAGDAQLLLDYVATTHPDLKGVKPRNNAAARKTHFGHFVAGHRVGQSAELNRGVPGMDERRLLS